MSKKNRRKKNNKARKNFDKNLFIKEAVTVKREVESGQYAEEKVVKKNKLKKVSHKKEVGVEKVDEIKKKIEVKFEKGIEILKGIVLDLKSSGYKFWIKFKRWNNIFCDSMTCRTNLKRDLIILSVVILIIILFFGFWGYGKSLKNNLEQKQEISNPQEELEILSEIQIDNIKTIQDEIDTTDWKEYKSNWYGFKIKYPKEWSEPVMRPLSRASQEIFKLSFISNDVGDEVYQGFDIVIYDIAKTKEFYLTSEFPKVKSPELKETGQCEDINGHIIETGDYPAEEIYISIEDDCYNPVLFFSVVKDQYMYNMVPVLKKDVVFEGDPMVKVSDELPEFFEAISQFENSEIVRPKPKPVAAKITAPKPASYKVENGRMVCIKKKDKPGKSDRGKGKHLDMECCLDPDEYPNPHCYYDPAKYGKYLK